jgi:uncharacterized caspase-like protein
MSKTALLKPWRIVGLTLLALVWPFGGLSAQQAQTDYRGHARVALVIGNSSYVFAPLDNPVNDAGLIAQALGKANFDVTRIDNASFSQMQSAIAEHVRKLSIEDTKGRLPIGALYFAGHGIQIRGENFLIPVDVTTQREAQVRNKAIKLSDVMEQLARAKNPLNLVFLDACRNNPFVRSTRGAVNGLARVEAGFGTLISFATAPGQFAEDGDGKHSPYSKALATHIPAQGAKVEDVLKRVRAAVKKETQDRQITWDASSVVGDFYFATSDEVIKTIQTQQRLLEPIAAQGVLQESEPMAQSNYRSAQLQSQVRDQLKALMQYDEQMQPLLIKNLRVGMQFTSSPLTVRVANGIYDTNLVLANDPQKRPINLKEMLRERFSFDGYEQLESKEGVITRFFFKLGTERYVDEIYQPYASVAEKSYTVLRTPFFSVDESDKAARMLMGQTLYTLKRDWREYTDKGPGKILAVGRRYVPVVIEEVRRAGGLSGTGWIIFRDAKGQRAVLPAILEARRREGSFNFGDTFLGKFSFVDPKAAHPQINAETWNQIEQGQIELGMSTAEVQLAQGRPTVLSRSVQSDGASVLEWRLSQQALKFVDNKLTQIRKQP